MYGSTRSAGAVVALCLTPTVPVCLPRALSVLTAPFHPLARRALPSPLTDGKPAYWDERYSLDPEPFEWYNSYAGLKDVLRPHLMAVAKPHVLQLGCGNSRLAEDMYTAGYQDITNVDISKVVIAAMVKRTQDKPSLRWLVQDVMQLDLPEASFDVVLDKGCLDSLLCGEDAAECADKMLLRVAKVLKVGASFLVFTYGKPENRLPYLEQPRYGWRVASTATIVKPQLVRSEKDESAEGVYYCYIMTKDG